MVVFGVAMVGLAGYSYYRGSFSQSEALFTLMAAVAWIAYTIEGASTFVSLPQSISGLLTGVIGVLFIGLFLYLAYNRQELSD